MSTVAVFNGMMEYRNFDSEGSRPI